MYLNKSGHVVTVINEIHPGGLNKTLYNEKNN